MRNVALGLTHLVAAMHHSHVVALMLAVVVVAFRAVEALNQEDFQRTQVEAAFSSVPAKAAM